MNNLIIKPEKQNSKSSKTETEQKLKKFRSAYILFSLEYRKELQKKYPNHGNPELTKMIAAEWKSLDISQKQIFYLKEKEEKENFEKKKREDNIDYKYNKNEKMKKPIRFRTPYMFYIMDHKFFLNNKDKYKNIELIKKLSEKWKAMTETEKLPYIDKSIADKQRYKLDWENYIKCYFKIKKKNIRKKEKTEKMVLDLLKICNNNENFHSHLQNVWSRLNSSGKLKQVYNSNGKSKNKILLKRLIFRIEKVPKTIEDEIKFVKSQTEDNVFSKFIKEEIDEDSNEDFFEIDDMMDMIVRGGINMNSKHDGEIKQIANEVIPKQSELLLGKKRGSAIAKN
jgi:hypothetical protein